LFGLIDEENFNQFEFLKLQPIYLGLVFSFYNIVLLVTSDLR